MRRRGVPSAVVLFAILFSRPAANSQGAASSGNELKPPPDISSCQPPKDVAGHLPDDLYGQIPFFDNYSWRVFAALVCDSQPDRRGVPDDAGGRNGSGPRVFETFKSPWEVYHSGKVSPVWNTYESQSANPCPNAPEGELVLASTSTKFDINQAGDEGVPLPPLPAQNGTFVHYLTQYNKKSFDYIVSTLAAPRRSIQFPVGSINIKSAWVEMKDLKPNPARFYSRQAWVKRADAVCENITVGLVGLHIVQKTGSRPHWIWSTFEQVDNVPDAGTCPTPGGPYTFNNGDCLQSMPGTATPGIFNVQRTTYLINGPKTVPRNQAYQALFAAQSKQSKWQYYELVMTQWPTKKNAPPAQAGDPEYTFPTSGTSSASANAVIETFFQRPDSLMCPGCQKLSCLGCHAEAGADYDFVWSRKLEP